MNLVVAERTMPGPMAPADVVGAIRGGGWCNELYGVSHLGSLLAPDRHTMVCFYRAPDAEAVRSTSRRLRAPYERVWSATLHGPHGPEPLTIQPPPKDAADSAATVLVSRSFETPMEFDALQAQEDAKAWCLAAHGVRFLQSLFAVDRRRMICLYTAPDAEAVRHAQRQAGLPFDAVWSATVCSP